MQLTKSKTTFDARKIEQTIRTESKFITDLLSILNLPKRNENFDDVDFESQQKPLKNNTERAKSLTELQDRLHAITSKKKLTYKDKLAKKNLKNRLKRKNKQDVRNAQSKLQRAQKIKSDPEANSVKPAKPVFNSEGKMVFSKFDFSNLGPQKSKKTEKDAKKILKKLEVDKEKMEELEESGEVGKVVEIKEKKAWKNALAKAEGVKVKDDVQLLKKTVKKQEQRKRASKKKWEKRQENVEKMKKEKQEKRSANIEKRKKEKKVKKLKNAAKRGKIVPGF